MTRKWFIALLLGIAILALVLRVVAGSVTPPSAYWEEVALGYDAYSLLKTGKDHHGHSWPLVALESFGDWKPSGYVYAAIPSIAIFGLTVWAVRLPSVIAGVAMVIGVAVLCYQLTQTGKKTLQQFAHLRALVAALIAAISPWALILSRSGWETNLATACALWSAILLLYAFSYQSARRYVCSVLAALLTVFAAYTYHATRVSAPLLLAAVTLFSWQQSSKSLRAWLEHDGRVILPAILVVVVGCMPLLTALITGSSVGHRLTETSIFSDVTIIEESNRLREANDYALWSRIAYHRYALFGVRMLQNAVSHLSPSFLFTTGDDNIRHATGFGGQLYLVESVFLLVGLAYFWSHARAICILLLSWIAIAILPASVTVATPHALRASLELPTLLILIGTGCVHTVKIITAGRRSLVGWAAAAIGGLYAVSFSFFWLHYTQVYPVVAAREWQYGYAQMVEQLTSQQKQHPEWPVFVTREQGRPAMYYWFFSTTDPRLVQAQNDSVQKDQGEYLAFEHVSFVRGAYEVSSVPAILASSEKFRQELGTLHPEWSFIEVSTVPMPDLSQPAAWNIYLVQTQ